MTKRLFKRGPRGRAWTMVHGFASTMVLSTVVAAQVVNYEGNSLPEDEGWERILAGTPGAERTLEDGWLVLYADRPPGWTSETGDADFYHFPLVSFAGRDKFFVEGRVITDCPSEVLDQSATPVVLVAGGRGAGFYHTTITDGRVQLFRDTMFPLIFVDIEPSMPHVYRIELDTDRWYAWYIDGHVVDTGTPQGAYPDPSSVLAWGAQRSYFDSVTSWDYVRFGVIPQDASGDYDSDSVVTLDDFYFFHECLTNDRPGINGGPNAAAGPGCRFADFDFDGDVDLLDFAAFQNIFTGTH